MRTRTIAVVVVLLLTSGQAASQDAREILSDSVVITANRFVEEVRQSGRQVTILTARDIAGQPVSSLDELLRTAGGIEMQSRGGFGVQSDFTIRGSGFNGVLVLLDGARVNDPMTGHFLAELPIPLSEVARVEILRGPATVLYGPDALGGVVQIFTYSGLAQAAPAQGTAGDAEIQIGENELLSLDGAVRHAGTRSGFSVGSAFLTGNGVQVTSPGGGPLAYRDGRPVRNDFSRQAHTASFISRLGRASLLARVGMDSREFGAWHYYTAFASDTAREQTSSQWAQVRLQGNPSASTPWELQVAARRHEDAYTYNPVTPTNRHISEQASVQGHLSHRFTEALSIMVGTSLAIRAIESNNLGDHSDPSAGAFVTTRWQPAANVTINAGGRLDYDPGYGLEPTPQLSGAWNLRNVTVRGGISRAVREPNYVERFYNTRLASPRGQNLGNPDLDPESAWAYEAGIDVYPVPGLTLQGTGFIRNTDNLIDYARVSLADTVWLARNILEVKTRGVEFDASYHRLIGDNRLHLSTSYTRLHSDLGEVPAETQFKYALTHARHLVQGNATLDVHGFVLGLHGMWKDRLGYRLSQTTEIPGGRHYGVVNARLGYRIHMGRQRLTLQAEMRNVLDERYSEVFDAPMPGRWWLLGARLSR